MLQLNDKNLPVLFKEVLRRAAECEASGVRVETFDKAEAYIAGVCHMLKLTHLRTNTAAAASFVVLGEDGRRVLSQLERGVPLQSALGLPGTIFHRDLGVEED
jgi:hypothetical protein